MSPSSASRRVSRASRSAARAWCRLLAKFFRIENDMLKKHVKLDTKEKNERVCASESLDQPTGTYRLQSFMAIMSWTLYVLIWSEIMPTSRHIQGHNQTTRQVEEQPQLLTIPQHASMSLLHYLAPRALPSPSPEAKSSEQDLLDLLCSILRCAKWALRVQHGPTCICRKFRT